MPVVGKHYIVLSDTWKKIDVSAYSPDYLVHKVPVIDADIWYDNPYDGGIRYFIVHNTLHVLSMNNNLIPPYIVQEVGIDVNNTPKIHIKDPSIDDHSLYFTDFKYRIPLSLNGIFSYSSSKPSIAKINNS